MKGLSPSRFSINFPCAIQWWWNYVVANVCALLPLLWVGLSWMPDQLHVYWRGEDANPVSIRWDGQRLQGEDYGKWSEGRVWRFYLREGMQWKDLSFCLPEEKGGRDVGCIVLQKWKLLKMGKAGAGLEPTEGLENVWRFGDARVESAELASWRVALGLTGLESLLLGVAWLFVRFHRREQWKKLWPSAVLVALTLTVLVQVALPVQSYLANQSAYPFSSGELAGAITLRFFWAFVLSGVAIGLLARCFGRWVLGAVLAFAVCLYLESGILSAGLPDLNGDWWFFQNKTRSMWDAVAWATVFVLAAGLHPVLKKRYGLVAACLLVMVLASMFDVKHEEKADMDKLVVHDFSPVETVVRSVTYSKNRNVLVFVIDSLEREQAHAIMQDREVGPKLREQFHGFTEYVDNVGAWGTSLPSVANMFTGLQPTSAVGLANYFASPYSTNSVLPDFLADGFNVFMDTEPLGYGFTSRGTEKRADTRGEGVFTRRLEGELGWTLGEVSRFRGFPFAGKRVVAALTDMKVPIRENWGEERVAYPALAKGDVKDGPGSFVFCHTRGVHGPVEVNRYGERLAQPDDSDWGRTEAGIWALGQLGALFDVLREKDVYDRSMILVLADHGRHGGEGRQGEKLPDNGRPFLWVKAAESSHEFAGDDAPTYHGQIADLLRKACHNDLSEIEIRKVLSAERRVYRLMSGFGGNIGVWAVERDGSISTRTETLGRGELPLLVPGRLYRLDRSHIAQDGAGIEFVHCGFWPSPVWLSEQTEMMMRFRLPKANKRYSLKLSLKMTQSKNLCEVPEGASVRLMQNGATNVFVDVCSTYRTEAVLHGLRPDSEDNVEIVGKRENGMNANIYFLDLRIGEE